MLNSAQFYFCTFQDKTPCCTDITGDTSDSSSASLSQKLGEVIYISENHKFIDHTYFCTVRLYSVYSHYGGSLGVVEARLGGTFIFRNTNIF